MSEDKTIEAGKGSVHVTVACKLPHGLRLQLYKMVPHEEPVLGGGTRQTTIAEATGDPVVLNGYLKPMGSERDTRIIGGAVGFALTHGIPRDFFEEWLRQNKDMPAVRAGLIFASDKAETVERRAKASQKMVNGLEPIDPNKPPRVSPKFRVERFKKDDGDMAAA